MDAVITGLLENGVPHLLLSLTEPFFHSLIIYSFMRRLLSNRLNIYTTIALALIYSSWFNMRTPNLFGTSYHYGMVIFMAVWTYLIAIFLFKGKIWKKIIMLWYFDIFTGIAQAIAFIPFMLFNAVRGIGGNWGYVLSSVKSDVMLRLLYFALFISVFYLLGYLSLSLWRKIMMQKFQPFYLFFIAYPVGQIYSLALVINPNMGDWFFSILSIFVHDVETAYLILALSGLFTGLIASIAILYYVLSQEKRAAIEAELCEAKRVIELEQARYMIIEKRSEEMAKIRHDFNNQLASVLELVKVGEDSTAQKIISALSNEINQERSI